MSLASNFNKLEFATLFPIDKIVYESPVLTYTQGASSETTRTVVNPYAKKCFITLVWSTNQIDYYPAQAYTTITNTYSANGWVDSTSVYIHTQNNTGSSITYYIKFVLDTID